MSLKRVKFAFSLLFIGILPVMGMNNENSASKWLGMPLDEQKTLDISFRLEDIDTISKSDPEKGLLLELHLKDLLSIKKITPNESIKRILEVNKDSQQEKMMGLIECASFIQSQFLENLIQYALTYDLISKELFKNNDTFESFCKIKDIYNLRNINEKGHREKLELMEELLPDLEIDSTMEYSLDYTFNPVINDIKTKKHANDEKQLDLLNNLTAFDVKSQNNIVQITTNSEKREQKRDVEKSLQTLLKSTSLPNKISLILRLNDLNKLISKNIDTAAKSPELNSLADALDENLIKSIFFSTITTYVVLIYAICSNQSEDGLPLKELRLRSLLLGPPLCSLVMTGIKKIYDMINSHAYNMSLIKYFLDFGSHFGLPIPTLYYLYQYYTKKILHDKQLHEMKREQKNIQNLIEEFKESIKKEYKN